MAVSTAGVLGPVVVGRRAELAAVSSLLGERRLVTLVGSAGIGKTTLALAVAAGLGGEVAVSTVLLAPLGDGALVASAVASAVGADPRRGSDPVDAAAQVIGTSRWLLVADNCEHVLDAAAEVVDQLLARCPNLRVLATSRERLDITGEQVWPVPSLSMTGPDGAVGDAVELFVERARALLPGFVTDQRTLDVVGEVCRRLDGIALAIELAAARVDTLSVEDLAARLDDCLALLDGAGRSRTRRLRAAIDWSYALLDADEQAVLRCLSVFPAGCTLDAIEAVAAGQVRPGGVLGVVGRLVAKSLVVADTTTPTRYRLLEAIRQFAHGQLEAAGEEDGTRTRQAAHYETVLAAKALRNLAPNQRRDIMGVRVEFPNLVSLFQWARAAGRHDQVLGVAAASGVSWRQMADASGTVAGDLIRDLVLASDQVNATVCGAAIAALAAYANGNNGDASDELGGWTVERAREAGDPRTLAHALAAKGQELLFSRPPAAPAVLEESVAAASAAGDELMVADSLRGDAAQAAAHIEQGRSDRGSGNELGLLLFDTAAEAARPALDHSRQHARRGHRTCIELECVRALAHLALDEGAVSRAAALVEDATQLAERVGNPAVQARNDLLQARTHRLNGDHAQAAEVALQAATLLLAREDPLGVVDALEEAAAGCAAGGQHDTAARLLGTADALRAHTGYGRLQRAQTIRDTIAETVTASIGADRLDQLLAAGATSPPGWWRTTNTATPAATAPKTTTAPPVGTLRHDQHLWHLDCGGETATLRDSKGLHALAVLLATPGVEHLAADLTGGPVTTGTGPTLDHTARTAYRARAQDLADDLAEAQRFGDHERAATARAELEAIADQLAAATGLGGRDRPQHSPLERARVNVTRTIRTAIKDLAAGAPRLAATLDRDIHTGTYCSYQPTPDSTITWTIHP